MFDCRGMDGKIRARCFSRRFFHMQGTIREWTEEKLEGGSSQILETSDLRAVTTNTPKNDDFRDERHSIKEKEDVSAEA